MKKKSEKERKKEKRREKERKRERERHSVTRHRQIYRVGTTTTTTR